MDHPASKAAMQAQQAQSWREGERLNKLRDTDNWQPGFGAMIGSGISGLNIGQTVKPHSPVDDELNENHKLLMELESAVNQLIGPLRSILSHDPRESLGASNEENIAADGLSCELERILHDRNASLRASIGLLRDIQDAIRL